MYFIETSVHLVISSTFGMLLEIFLKLIPIFTPPAVLQIYTETIRLTQIQADCFSIFLALANRWFLLITAENSVVFLPSAVVRVAVLNLLRFEIFPAFAILLIFHLFAACSDKDDCKNAQ